MKFWFQRSEKDKNAAFVGVEHGGAAGFAEVRVGKREALRAAGYAGMALLLRMGSKRFGEERAMKERKRRRKETRRMMRELGGKKRR